MYRAAKYKKYFNRYLDDESVGRFAPLPTRKKTINWFDKIFAWLNGASKKVQKKAVGAVKAVFLKVIDAMKAGVKKVIKIFSSPKLTKSAAVRALKLFSGLAIKAGRKMAKASGIFLMKCSFIVRNSGLLCSSLLGNIVEGAAHVASAAARGI